jgi:hypothetical protein
MKTDFRQKRAEKNGKIAKRGINRAKNIIYPPHRTIFPKHKQFFPQTRLYQIENRCTKQKDTKNRLLEKQP